MGDTAHSDDTAPLEVLHELVPAALEEDLLDEVAEQRHRSEYEELGLGWSAWPGDTRQTPYDDELPESQAEPAAELTTETAPDLMTGPETDLTPGQTVGLLEHQLGAREVSP